MARTNLPLIALTGNSVALNPTATTIDASNGMSVTIPTNAIPAGGNIDRLVLYVANTTSSTKTVTVKAGSNTNYPNVPAFESSKGDLTTGNLTATTGTAIIGPFEVSRFIQSDNTLLIDFAASTAGTIQAILLPRVF